VTNLTVDRSSMVRRWVQCSRYPSSHLPKLCVDLHVRGCRCDRHNSALHLICRNIESMGHSMIHEPVIPTKVGRRKPDLVALVDEVAYVVDVTITLDSNDISGP